eukprot:g45815.t1
MKLPSVPEKPAIHYRRLKEKNAKKDLVRDLESKGVEVVTIQSGRHISVLAAESDVAVDVPSKVPFTPTRHSSSFLSSFQHLAPVPAMPCNLT